MVQHYMDEMAMGYFRTALRQTLKKHHFSNTPFSIHFDTQLDLKNGQDFSK